MRGNEGMSFDEEGTQAAPRDMSLWILTIAFASVCYVLATGHDVFDDPFGKPIEQRVYPLFFFLIIPLFGFVQAVSSPTFPSGFWRVGAFSLLFSIGFWEEWKIGAIYGVFLLVLYAVFRLGLDKSNWQARSFNDGLDRIGQNTRLGVFAWIAIPVLNLIAAIFLHPILTALFSSGGGSPDSIRLYSIRPSLIRRVDMLNWNGLIIFAAISLIALFMLYRRRKK